MTWKNGENLNSSVPELLFGLSNLHFIIIFEFLTSKKPSAVVCKNFKSKHYNPKNTFQIKFGISVHCVPESTKIKGFLNFDDSYLMISEKIHVPQQWHKIALTLQIQGL